MSMIVALRRWGQGDQKFKVILDYTVSSRPSWATQDETLFKKLTDKKRRGETPECGHPLPAQAYREEVV